jgi:hypothetical protein
MALSNISLLNTFTEQMVRVNQLVVEMNKWIDGNAYSLGTITVNGATFNREMLLDVQGNTKSTRVFVGDGSLAIPSIARSAGANVGIYFPAANTMALVAASNAAVTVLPSGNVSVGSSSASAKLFVEGTFSANGRTYFGANVGINKLAPTRALDVVGDIWATGDITMESDARMKTDIKPLNDALAVVGMLDGVQYNKIDTGRPQIGLIAQDVQKWVPSAVSTQPDGTLGINYMSLVAVLIEAIKELKTKLDEK